MFLLFWWVFAILALLVRINLGSPVIFKQDRPGKDRKIFKLYKFRSMSNATDKDGNLLPDKERLTKFGRLLRSTSLDELPELFNILKGDMSLIGPRPLLVKYLEDSSELYDGDISDINKVSVGATIGTYAGPGAIAVAFFPKGVK